MTRRLLDRSTVIASDSPRFWATGWNDASSVSRSLDAGVPCSAIVRTVGNDSRPSCCRDSASARTCAKSASSARTIRTPAESLPTTSRLRGPLRTLRFSNVWRITPAISLGRPVVMGMMRGWLI